MNANNEQTVDIWETMGFEHIAKVRAIVLCGLTNDSPNTGPEILDGDQLTIGRSNLSDIQIAEDNRLSKVHFSLQMQDGAAHITDMGSTNGTFMNGNRVDRCEVTDGDLITAGSSAFKVKFIYE